MSRNTLIGRTTRVLLAAVVVLHVAGAVLWRSSLWGTHLYAFFPGWVLPVATAALLLCVWLARSPEAPLARSIAAAPDPERWPRRRRALFLAAGSLLGGVTFWLLRARHTLLGDGNVIVLTLPEGGRIHERAPLAGYVCHLMYRFVRAVFPDLASADAAQRAVALGSVIAGMLLVPTLWGLSTEIHRLGSPAAHAGATGKLRGRGASSTSPCGGEVALFFALLISQGYLQLVCGYVEGYAWLLLLVAAYLWVSLRYLTGGTPLFWPGVVGVLALSFHLSGGMVLPSFGLLAAFGLARAETRRSTARDLLLLAGASAGILLFLYFLGGGYSLLRTFVDVARQAVLGSDEPGTGYLRSWKHVADFVNEQLLIGPLGLWLFLPMMGHALKSRAHRSPVVAYLLFLGLTFLGASWVARDSNLGYARNWDLLAVGGLVFSAAALGMYMHAKPALPRAWILLWMLAMSLYHTAPWIALNTSEERSLARMKALPLGLGRTELVVGSWYLREGQRDQARSWLERSVASFAYNVSACNLLGNIYMLDGTPGKAVPLFDTAVRLRPSDMTYRRKLVQALVAARNPAAAATHCDVLARSGAMRAEDCMRCGNALRAAGQPDRAAQVFQQALGLYRKAWEGHPTDLQANLDLGRALAELGDADQALQYFRRAAETQPTSPRALFYMGGLLVQMGRANEAEPALRKALELGPSNREKQQILEWLRQIDAASPH